MEWLSSTYLKKKESEVSTAKNKKDSIITNLKYSLDAVDQSIQALKEEDISEIVDFFAGEKNKL